MKKSFMLLAAGVAVALAVIGYFYVQHQQTCEICAQISGLNVEKIRHFIQGFGPWAIVVYVLLYIANSFTPFLPPIGIMSLAAGAVFGPWLGLLALCLGTYAGTTAVFLSSRYLFSSKVEKMLEGKGKDVYNKLSNQGFFVMLTFRLIGFPPYGLIDLMAGLSKMRFIDFVLATVVGTAPWIVPQVLLADRIANFSFKDPVLWAAAGFFVLMIWGTSVYAKKKQAEGSLPDSEGLPDQK